MTKRAWARAVIVIAAISISSLARADRATDLAEKEFQAGVALANQKQFDAAARRFEESYRLDPARGTLLALALAEQRGGHPARSHGHYTRLLSEAHAAGDAEREAIAKEQLTALDALVGKITLGTGGIGPGADVVIDDKSVVLSGDETLIVVDPGDHRVRAKSAARGSFSRDVALVAGSTIRIDIVLSPDPSTPSGPPERPADKAPAVVDEGPGALFVSGWVALGLGVASAAAGTGLWIESGSIFDEVKEACEDDPGCPGSQQDRADEGKTMENAARGTWIAGGVLAAAGITMIAIGWPTPAQVSVRAWPTGVAFRASF